MELILGSVLIALSCFIVAVKLWMVHHAARLTERDRGVGLWSGVLIPPVLFMTGLYCMDNADRGLWFSVPVYLGMTVGLAVLLLLAHLGVRAYGHRIRTGRWSRHRL
jgi:hypothetical protein